MRLVNGKEFSRKLAVRKVVFCVLVSVKERGVKGRDVDSQSLVVRLRRNIDPSAIQRGFMIGFHRAGAQIRQRKAGDQRDTARGARASLARVKRRVSAHISAVPDAKNRRTVS